MSETVRNQIIMNDIRLLRVSLTKPYTGKNAQIDPNTGKPKAKYHIDGVFAQSHPQYAELAGVIRGVATAKWAENTDATLNMIGENNQRFPLQKGDKYRPGKPAYAGLVYLSAGNDDQPTIVVTKDGVNIANRNTPVVLTPSDPCWPYEGSYANVHFQFYTYSYNGSPGLGCSVLGVQFYKHGERLRGSSVSGVGEFGIVPGAADGPPPGAGGGGAPARGGAGLI